MRSLKQVLRATALLLGAALLQSSPASAQEQSVQIQVTANDYAAAKGSRHRVHTSGALRPGGGRHPAKTFETDSSGALVEVTGASPSSIQSMAVAASQAATVTPPFTGPGFFPADLSMLTTTGQVVTSAQVHNIYVNCTGACWGNPSVFENRLFSSKFMDVVDQYVGSEEEGRYRLGPSVMINYPITKTLVTAPLVDDGDLDVILHAAASKLGGGFNHIYNIFLPKGVDECAGVAPPYTVCFSPDNVATWVSCATHFYSTYSDVAGTVFVTVEPYPDVFTIFNGLPFYNCDVGQPDPTTNTNPTPNGVLVDSLSSELDHEIFETITDPDFAEWQALNSLALPPGTEIGDLCVNPNYLYTPFYVSGHLYEIQPVYSNKYHACVTVP